MSRFGRCPECEVGDLYIEEHIPDWGTEENASYNLVCNHCGYSEETDFDPEDEE